MAKSETFSCFHCGKQVLIKDTTSVSELKKLRNWLDFEMQVWPMFEKYMTQKYTAEIEDLLNTGVSDCCSLQCLANYFEYVANKIREVK